MPDTMIAIDLGTTNCVVAVYDAEQNRPRALKDMEGLTTVPSYVAIVDAEDLAFSGTAARMFPAFPSSVARSFKRNMGVRADGKLIDILRVGRKVYNAVALSALLLGYLSKCVNEALGWTPKDAVITVPAYFGDAARKDTKDAARAAGFQNVLILNEPTVASLAYRHETGMDGTVAVFDWGGGTFDISVVDLHEDGCTVLATGGDKSLGGDDVDGVITEMVLTKFQEEHGFLPTQDEHLSTFVDLAERVPRAKIDLGQRKKTMVPCSAGGCESMVEITRDAMEEKCSHLFERMISITEQVIKESGVDRDQLRIILVGGSTRMKAIPRLIKERLGMEPVKADVEPDLAVALGAAIATTMSWDGTDADDGALSKFQDITGHPLGVEVVKDGRKVISLVIQKNSQIPTECQDIYRLHRAVQTYARIRVFQGAEGISTDDPEAEFLGLCELRGLPVRETHEKRIKVTFSYDRNGMVHVLGEDLVSGKKTDVLQLRPGLTDDEVEATREEVEGLLSNDGLEDGE